MVSGVIDKLKDRSIPAVPIFNLLLCEDHFLSFCTRLAIPIKKSTAASPIYITMRFDTIADIRKSIPAHIKIIPIVRLLIAMHRPYFSRVPCESDLR